MALLRLNSCPAQPALHAAASAHVACHQQRAPRTTNAHTMSLSQALKLAQAELAGLSGRAKVQRMSQIARLFAAEVAGTVALAPFALKASQLHRSLRPPPPPDGACCEDPHSVHVVKNIHYGSRPRNTLDLYVPAAASRQRVPVVLFVHGGVWAAGDAWHYAPLAASLARLGVMAVVMQYTLYPDALVPQLVREVSAALDWALDNVGAYGGDARQVSLVGHSAGAQLCMMALLQRAAAAHEADSATAPAQQQQQQQQQQTQTHLAMPCQFVGVTGVYNIAHHFAFEKARGVHSLSTMLPAMGGFSQFAAQSPSVILAAALQQQQQSEPQQGKQQLQQQLEQEPPACDFYETFPLAGESISHRIGFDRGSEHEAAAEAGLLSQSLAGMAGVLRFPLAAAARLPPAVLMSSCTDMTVPWYESAEMYWRLHDCGVPVKHLVYNKVGHGEFVTDWPASFTAAAGGVPTPKQGDAASGGASSSMAQTQQQWLRQLPPYCRDLAVVVLGQQPVNFVRRPGGARAPGAHHSNATPRAKHSRSSSSNGGARQRDTSPAAADAEVLVGGAAGLN